MQETCIYYVLSDVNEDSKKFLKEDGFSNTEKLRHAMQFDTEKDAEIFKTLHRWLNYYKVKMVYADYIIQ